MRVKGADGKWTELSRLVHGKRADARRVANELELQKAQGTLGSAGPMTVGEFLNRWLESYCRQSLSPRTFIGYEGIVRQHLIPALGNIRLEKLTPLDIQGYYSQALAGGRKDDRAGEPLSPTTVLKHHAVLHEALYHATKWGLIPRNPADLVEPPRKAKPEMNVLGPDEVPALLEALRGSYLYLPAFLAIYTGMRLSEILGLRWQDVDLERGTVHVQQTLYYPRSGEFTFLPPKTPKSRRVIEIGPEAARVLRQQRARQAEWKLKLGGRWPGHDLVCTRPDGMPVYLHSISSNFRKAARRAGFDIRFHDLRHTHATLLLRAGEHPKVVAERLGHSTVTVTLDTYSHVVPGMQRQAALKLERLLAASACGKNCGKETAGR